MTGQNDALRKRIANEQHKLTAQFFMTLGVAVITAGIIAPALTILHNGVKALPVSEFQAFATVMASFAFGWLLHYIGRVILENME